MKKQIKIITAILMLAVYLVSMISFASALIIDSVSMSPKEVSPGESASIEIILENDREKDISDVSISLIFRGVIKDSFGNVVSVNELPFAPFDSSSEISFDEIKEDDDARALFKIIVLGDAKSGIYKIPVEISYIEDGEEKEKDSLISVIVNSEPEISVGVEDGLLLKGEESELRIEIVNKGLSEVKFLEVEMGVSTSYDLISSDNVYIGDIDSDDFDSAEFKVRFKDSALTKVRVPVVVSYKDVMNKEYSEDFDLNLKVYSKDKAIELGLLEKDNTKLYVVIVIVLIVVYFGYKNIKKSRLKRAKEEY